MHRLTFAIGAVVMVAGLYLISPIAKEIRGFSDLPVLFVLPLVQDAFFYIIVSILIFVFGYLLLRMDGAVHALSNEAESVRATVKRLDGEADRIVTQNADQLQNVTRRIDTLALDLKKSMTQIEELDWDYSALASSAQLETISRKFDTLLDGEPVRKGQSAEFGAPISQAGDTGEMDRQEDELFGPFETGLIKSMVAMSLVDGRMDADEIHRTCDVFHQVTAHKATPDTVQRMGKDMAASGYQVGRMLTNITPYIDDSQKVLIIQAACLVARADGRLDDEEVALAFNIADALDVEANQAKQIIGDVFA